MKASILLALALLAVKASAQEAANQPNPAPEPSFFAKVERTGDDKWRRFFIFSAGGNDYTIRGDGYGESHRGTSRPHSFHLNVDRGHLEQLSFLERDGDLLLIYEVTNGTSDWGYAARFSQSTFKAKWMVGISAVDFGPTLVDDGYAYLTAAGFIAKVDLQTGAYIWRQEKLYEKYKPSFVSFSDPWIKGDHVFFKEDSMPFKTIEVDKVSGKIINVLD